MANGIEKPLVFVSYSKADRVWKDDYLLVHLDGLENAGLITTWSDDDIDRGGAWLDPIVEAMSEAHVAVCLLSPNYLKTKFIVQEEIPLLLQRAEHDGLKLLFLLVEPCDWQAHYWLEQRQMFLAKGACVSVDYVGRKHLPFAMLAKHIRQQLDYSPKERKPLAISNRVAEALDRINAKADAAIADFNLTKDFVAASRTIAVQGHGDTIVQHTEPDDELTTLAGGPKLLPHPPLANEFIDLTRLPVSGYDVVGRDSELRMLDEALDGSTLNVISFRAWGGVGKSTLVNKWCEYLAADNFRGAQRVFAWSFYSQGTNDRTTSADAFIDAALRFFDDEDPEAGSAWAKGERLAELVGKEKALLILDGMEPLQDEHQGIKDPALARLIECLAVENAGLCVITTREPVKELRDFPETTREQDLEYLTKQAGRALLRIKDLRAADELLEQVSEAFGNHALALDLLASYLKHFAYSDVSQALDIPDLPDIPLDAGKHPRRVMAAFAEKFGEGPELDLLHLMGLFDRPADARCIAALRKPPVIPGLTDHLVQENGGRLASWWRRAFSSAEPSTDAIWEKLLTRLRALGLLAKASHHAPDDLDAHPLVREHFGARLRAEREDAWKAGHDRLYEHLKGQAEHRPNTLTEMVPLFQAVHHGCRAGRRQEALDEVYHDRIVRKYEHYLVRRLGAFGTDLGLVASFFDPPFEHPAADLNEDARAWLLNTAAFHLRALGRLGEAVAPLRAVLARDVEEEAWKEASASASNLSELQLTLGDVAAAVASGKAAVDHADRSGDALEHMINRTTLASARHQAGTLDAATDLFEKAETMQAEHQPTYPLLYSLQGYQYCDLLLNLDQAEAVRERASQSLAIAEHNNWLLDIGLDHLSLGRATLALGDHDEARARLDQAVDGLREAGQLEFIPHGLLARAAFFREVDDGERARKDLDEAMRIATRCGMRLHECDAHIEYARLALAEDQPDAARDHLKSATSLVNECGYHRREPEITELKEKLSP